MRIEKEKNVDENYVKFCSIKSKAEKLIVASTNLALISTSAISIETYKKVRLWERTFPNLRLRR